MLYFCLSVAGVGCILFGILTLISTVPAALAGNKRRVNQLVKLGCLIGGIGFTLAISAGFFH